MLQTITITNHLGEELELSMFNPGISGFYIKSIDGLGPTTANINVIDIVSQDGSVFNSSRNEKRNIVLTLGVYDTANVEYMRQQTYKYFPIKRKIKLAFKSDEKSVYTFGYVETNEPDIFSKMQTYKISIICPFPYFYSEFNNSITYFNDGAPHTISYDGDVETGLIIRLSFYNTVKNLAIINGNNKTFSINDSYLAKVVKEGIRKFDSMEISTIVNEKHITFFQDTSEHESQDPSNYSLKATNQNEGISLLADEDGSVSVGTKEYNILNAMDRNSTWFKIGKGNNTFTITATEGQNDIAVSIVAPILYEGI